MTDRVVVERDVAVAMRDGVLLATDVYRLDDNETRPALVMRTPYGKSVAWNVGSTILNPLDAAQQGFVVVVQDTRGRYGSRGRWEPFVCEADDGYDTVEWAAAQPWCDGHVGVYGSSYDGVTALQAACAAPPHLGAVVAYITGGNYQNGWVYSGGAFELGFGLRWVSSLAWDALARRECSDEERAAYRGALASMVTDPWATVGQLPVRDVSAIRDLAPYFLEWLDHPTYDEYWSRIDVVARAGSIRVPVFHVAGWYDIFLRGHLDLQGALAAHPDARVRKESRFWIGPWDHEAYLSIRTSSSGLRSFGPDAASGPALMADAALSWFAHWLRAVPPALGGQAPVRFYDTGVRRWEDAASWPPPRTPGRWYLHTHGRLTTEAPEPGEQPDAFTYDPTDPVPTVGGRTLHPDIGPSGMQDQTAVEQRADVLVFTSEPLRDALCIIGPVSAVLFVASDAPDTDFTAKLVAVEPDGFNANIAEGICRARYRNGARPDFLTPGVPVQLRIDLWDVAHTLPAGHRLRLEVSSSNFPRFDRNPNNRCDPAAATVEDFRIAHQQVFHDPERASYVELS